MLILFSRSSSTKRGVGFDSGRSLWPTRSGWSNDLDVEMVVGMVLNFDWNPLLYVRDLHAHDALPYANFFKILSLFCLAIDEI